MLYTLNTFSLSRLNNQEFVGLMINIQKVLTDANRENLGLESSVLSQYNTTLQKLMDQVYCSTASPFTQQMKAADEKRGLIYRRIRLKLQTVDYLEEGSRMAKYADLVKTDILGKYTGNVPQLPYQEETAVLSGFIFDLRDKLDDDAIEELAIEDDIAKLELANTAFVKAYNARANEKAELEAQRTALLRQELGDTFAFICFSTQYLANSTSDKHTEMAPECQNVIRLLNVLLNEARTRLIQRLKQNVTDDDETSTPNQGSQNAQGGSGTNGGNGGGTGGSNTQGGSGTGSGNDDFVINDGTAEY